MQQLGQMTEQTLVESGQQAMPHQLFQGRPAQVEQTILHQVSTLSTTGANPAMSARLHDLEVTPRVTIIVIREHLGVVRNDSSNKSETNTLNFPKSNIKQKRCFNCGIVVIRRC